MITARFCDSNQAQRVAQHQIVRLTLPSINDHNEQNCSAHRDNIVHDLEYRVNAHVEQPLRQALATAEYINVSQPISGAAGAAPLRTAARRRLFFLKLQICRAPTPSEYVVPSAHAGRAGPLELVPDRQPTFLLTMLETKPHTNAIYCAGQC